MSKSLKTQIFLYIKQHKTEIFKRDIKWNSICKLLGEKKTKQKEMYICLMFSKQRSYTQCFFLFFFFFVSFVSKKNRRAFYNRKVHNIHLHWWFLDFFVCLAFFCFIICFWHRSVRNKILQKKSFLFRDEYIGILMSIYGYNTKMDWIKVSEFSKKKVIFIYVVCSLIKIFIT